MILSGNLPCLNLSVLLESIIMRQFTIFFTIFCFLVSGCGKGPNGLKGEGSVVVGSKNFTESIILAELLAQQIEAATGKHVIIKFNLGGTFICHKVLQSGEFIIFSD